MKILLDECLPTRLKSALKMFESKTVSEMGWKSLRNGKLLKISVEEGFDIFLTIDKNLKFQQNINSFDITVVVFDVPKNKIELILPIIPQFIEQVSSFEKRRTYIIK